MRARVFVTLKPSVFDPQGKTIVDALHSLGYGGVEDVRQGKYFELEIAADSSDKARSMASAPLRSFSLCQTNSASWPSTCFVA